MAERPWWLRVRGTPPGGAERAKEDQARPPLSKEEVRKTRKILGLLILVAFLVLGYHSFLNPTSGYFAFVFLGVAQFILVRKPLHHRRQILGLRPKTEQPPGDHD